MSAACRDLGLLGAALLSPFCFRIILKAVKTNKPFLFKDYCCTNTNAMSHRLYLYRVQCLMLLYVHRDCMDYYYKYNTSNSSTRDREPKMSTSTFTQLLSLYWDWEPTFNLWIFCIHFQTSTFTLMMINHNTTTLWLWRKVTWAISLKMPYLDEDLYFPFHFSSYAERDCIYIYIYMSLWQKVLPLNPGMFVYSYLFSSYYSYTKLWLLLFSMHWWVVKVKIGSFGHQEED